MGFSLTGDNKEVSTSYVSATTIEAIEHRIAPLKQRVAHHPLYAAIQTPHHLRIFMESHVFAVWDFMSLLKSLQRTLTSVDVPWVPTAYASSRRFINEIVFGEESDQYQGRSLSHFEIYLEAMQAAGASTAAIDRTLAAARRCRPDDWSPLDAALEAAPLPARRFAQSTFRIVRTGSVAAQAAAFTFGREDAIPDMFRSLVRDFNHTLQGDLSQFVWYLERHIEVDGDEHGPLSLRMVQDLCGHDPLLWEQAAQAAEDALTARLALWDGILAQLQS